MRFVSVMVAGVALALGGVSCALVAGLAGDATLLKPDAGTGGAGTGGAGGPTCVVGSPCYTGPAGTENVGLCKGGQTTCTGDGTPDVCAGEVTPQPKTCATMDDVHCDSLPCVDWAHGYGPDMAGEEITAVALDPSDGSMVVTGDFSGTMRIGTTMLTAANSGGYPGGAQGTPQNRNIFVARIAADGTPVWAETFGPDLGLAIAVDSSGNVYVGGRCAGSTTVGTGASALSLKQGQFILKLDKSGAPQWATSLGDAIPNLKGDFFYGMSSLAVSPDGSLIAAGQFEEPLTFADGSVQPPASGLSGYVAKMSMTGTGSSALDGTAWTRVFSGVVDTRTNAASGPRAGVDASGYVYVGTTFTGTMTFDAGSAPFTSNGGTDIAILRFDPTGAVKGAISLGNAADQTLDALAVSPFGALTLAGQLQGTLTFTNPAGTLSAQSAMGDGVVFQLGPYPEFSYLWGTPFGVNGEALDVGLDTAGNVRVLGWFTGTFDLGKGALDASGNRMLLLAELASANGSVSWNRGWIYPGTYTDVHLAVAPAGDSFVGATVFAGAFNVGTGALANPADISDAWTGRFAP